MAHFTIDKNIFSRYDIYMFFLQRTPLYNEAGNKIVTAEEYYELEQFFANEYSCNCSDCGGKDVSRQCAVENAFKSRIGTIKNEDLV